MILPLELVLSQLNSVHTFTSYFFNLYHLPFNFRQPSSWLGFISLKWHKNAFFKLEKENKN